ncbi:fetuin-B-like [Sorex fumeus]|uniref:fetuin-B-like n=1 Tax=Sorex fumeus TaxID=62283 RepID=UPI0024AD135F|nr:fetuin-B-like [Sorex fumeus]
MMLLLSLVLCALTAGCRASFPAQQAITPSPIQARSCNDKDVLSFADFALDDINRDRKDGYVLSLNRVSDAWEQRQADGMGSLFYLTLDVLETECHVLSGKSSKDCEKRSLHESVYGQCKALFYINKPKRVLYTHAYNCTLRPVSRRSIQMMCPDCPSPSDLSNPSVLEAATESLAKYNRESASKQYSLVKVTKATSQWVNGPAYFVEYLIKESPCTKSQGSRCTLQSSNAEPVGLCQGSLTKIQTEKFISVNCNFFKSQAAGLGSKTSSVKQQPARQPKQKNTTPSTSKGSVQNLPDLDDEKTKGSQKAPVEAFPVNLDLTTNPQGVTVDISFLFIGAGNEKLLVKPFPKKDKRSAQCPGTAEQANSSILPP